MKLNLTRRSMLGGVAAVAGLSALSVPARAATVLRYGNAGNPGTLSNQFNKKLSDMISAKTNGGLSFEIFAGSLGGEQKLLESMALGSLDVYNGAYTGTRQFDIFYSPYFFKDGAHAKRVLDSDIGTAASAELKSRYNGRLLGAGRLGSYNLMLKEPIKSLADLKGRKIRSPQIEGCLEALKHFGAIPTPIPFNEIYLSLQNGIVDGVLTALNPGVQGKFYEVCKYVVTTDFGLALDKEVISEAVWTSLPDDQKTALQTSFTELEEAEYYQVGLKLKDVDLAAWGAANGQDALITLDATGLAAEMEPVNKRLADEVYGPGAWDKIKAL